MDLSYTDCSATENFCWIIENFKNLEKLSFFTITTQNSPLRFSNTQALQHTDIYEIFEQISSIKNDKLKVLNLGNSDILSVPSYIYSNIFKKHGFSELFTGFTNLEMLLLNSSTNNPQVIFGDWRNLKKLKVFDISTSQFQVTTSQEFKLPANLEILYFNTPEKNPGLFGQDPIVFETSLIKAYPSLQIVSKDIFSLIQTPSQEDNNILYILEKNKDYVSNPNAKNPFTGFNLLHQAVYSSRSELIIETLLKSFKMDVNLIVKPSVTRSNHFYMNIPTREKEIEELPKSMIDSSNMINPFQPFYPNPSCHFVQQQNPNLLKMHHGFSPLHIAAHKQNKKISRVLLNHGANVDALVDSPGSLFHGLTPFIIASYFHNIDLMNTFLEYGYFVLIIFYILFFLNLFF